MRRFIWCGNYDYDTECCTDALPQKHNFCLFFFNLDDDAAIADD